MKRLPNTEKRPFFIDQSKSGKWNVNVFNRIAKNGDYLYSIKQTCKTESRAEEWGVNYINTVYRTFDQVTTNWFINYTLKQLQDKLNQMTAQQQIAENVLKYTNMLCEALIDNFKSRNNGKDSGYKFYPESGRKYHKIIMETGAGSRSVHAFVDKNTGEVYKPASFKAPAKYVRYDLRLIKDREFLFEKADWAGGYLYLK